MLEKGFNFLLSTISDKVESSYFKVIRNYCRSNTKRSNSFLQVKSSSNISREDEFVPCTPPHSRKERSLSVNSYLVPSSPGSSTTPPTIFPHGASLTTSPRESPRNLSLPANRLFFFPPNFQAENLIPGSRKTSSDTSDLSKTPLSSRTASPTPPSKSLLLHRSHSPSPGPVSPLPSWGGASYRQADWEGR